MVAAALGLAIPEVLRQVYSRGDGRYQVDGEWWVVWPVDRVVTENPKAWSEGTLDRDLIAFGDDGTCNPFCLRRSGDNEVVRWSWICRDIEDDIGSVAEFLTTWVDTEGSRCRG